MKSSFKKQIAVLLTLVLAFSVTVPVSAEGTDDSVQKVTVTLSGQYDNEFFFAPGEYEIPSDEAEKYGYEDEQGGVTALDALVYAHELAYGKDFTTETKDQYLTVTDGSVKKAFGRADDIFDFLVNDRYPHTEEYIDFMEMYEKMDIDQAKISNGDQVDFCFVQQFEDKCAWFTKDNNKVTSLEVEENSSIDLVLMGYVYFMKASQKEDDIQNKCIGYIENAQITLIKRGNITSEPIEKAITNMGKVTLSGLKAGEYYLSAFYPKTDGLKRSMVMPLCKLQVKAKETPKPEPTPEPTPEPKKDDTTQATTEAKKDAQTTTEVTTEAPTTQQVVVLDKPSGDKVKSTKKKQIKITLKARKNITGYQIEVSTSSKFKNAKAYKVKNTVSSKTIKSLKSKETYYVRIRTYKQFVENNQKVTIYSKWSKVKKITVK